MSLNFTNIKATIGGKKLPWMISEKQFQVPRNTVPSNLGVISLLWQFRCDCHTAVVVIFSSLCQWRRSLCSNLGVTLRNLFELPLKKMKHALNVGFQPPRNLFNKQFSSYPKPLFQSEATCEAIDLKKTSYYPANKTDFNKSGRFSFSLVLKMRVFG